VAGFPGHPAVVTGPANFEVSSRVDKQVLRLEVSMHDIQSLEIFERQDHLTCVQLGLNLAVTASTQASMDHTLTLY